MLDIGCCSRASRSIGSMTAARHSLLTSPPHSKMLEMFSELLEKRESYVSILLTIVTMHVLLCLSLQRTLNYVVYNY